MMIFRKNLKILLTLLFAIGVFSFFVLETKHVDSSEVSNFSITIVPAPQCFDGQDNDLDGFIDYPDDPECTSYTDDDETDGVVVGGGGGGGGGGGSSTPPETGITFSGRAYPKSEVIILQDGVRVIQTIAGKNAKFSVSIDDLSPGNYNFTVTSIDKNELQSSPFSFPVYISQGSSTDVSGIFLAPTMSSDKSQVRRGDDITLFGQTIPESEVTIEVNSENQIFVDVVSDNDGVYIYDFDSSVLEYGEHSTQSKTKLEDGVSSGFGALSYFKVGNTNIERGGETWSCNADLNKDTRVNLVDFSIAAFWYKRVLNGEIVSTENSCLNGDGTINLIDFSIMAFYWTG